MYRDEGFTLIELLVTVAIIGILAMIAIPGYIGQQRKATRVEAQTNLMNLRLLEEQFFAESGSYTISLGTPLKDHPANVNTIQTGGGDPTNALTGFRPGTGLAFSYWIVQNQCITNSAANPPTAANVPNASCPNTNVCFVAFAQGNTGSRAVNEYFAIDCNNIKNF